MVAVLTGAGFSEEDATRGADVLMWATLRGVDTHGIRNLKTYYVDGVSVGCRDGAIDPEAVLETDRETETSAQLNANGGLGLSVSVQAMELAIAKARNTGVGIVTVRNSTHFGAAGCYAQMAADEDMIGLAATGYLFVHGQHKAVVPFGGILPMFSTNPLAMACPALEEAPFVLDMATSVVPINRVEMREALGRDLPEHWALDAEGRPTADPSTVNAVVPLGGATTNGGHKGFGLAVAVQILCGILSGAWKEDPDPDRILGETPETKNGFAQEGIGHCFAAIRLDQFGDPKFIKRGLDSMIRTLNESPAAEGFDRVRVAGQPEHEAMKQRLADGIPLPDPVVSDLKHLSEQFDVALKLEV